MSRVVTVILRPTGVLAGLLQIGLFSTIGNVLGPIRSVTLVVGLMLPA